MAFSPDNLLSTPQGYATPEQLAAMREYGDALMRGSMRDKPITSPWQGVRMMADALAGRTMQNRANQQGLQNLNIAAQDQASIPPVNAPPTAPQSSPIGPTASASPGVASVRNNNPGAQWPGPVASAYGATGSQTIGGGNKIASFPDPVHGAAAEFALLAKNYSGMPLGSAIAKWSGGNSAPAYAQYVANQTGLSPNTVLTPQLLSSPQGLALGRAIANWEAGGRSPLSDQQWTQAHQMAFGGGQRTQTADLSGTMGAGGPPPAGGPQMAGGPSPQAGPQVAAGGRAPMGGAEPPLPTVGAPQFGSQYVPGKPSIDRDTLQRLLASPVIGDQEKQMYQQMYLQQYQPVEAAGPGGHWVVPYGGRGQPLWIPELKTLKEGEFEVPTTSDPNANITVHPPQGGVQGGAPSAPPAPPPVWNKFNPAPPQAPANPPGPQGSNAPASSPSMLSQGALPPKPVQVASLDPRAGMGAAPGAAAQAPPVTPPAGASTLPVAQRTSQVAQAGPTVPAAGPLGPFVDQLKQWDINNKAQQEGANTQAKAFSESAEKDREGYSEAAMKSAEGMSQLQEAMKAVDDPKFISGVLAKPGLTLRQLQAVLGPDPKAARPIETFNKIMASQTLPELSTQTKNMGQVRLAELQVVQSSLANTSMTPEGIKSVLQIMMRAHQLNMDVAQLANSYAQGWRLGDDGKPYKTAQKGFDYDWQPTLQKYLAANPIITPELRNAFESGSGLDLAAEAAKLASHPQPQSPPPGFHEAPPPPPGFSRPSNRPQPQAPP